jgi:hypothetical protein
MADEATHKRKPDESTLLKAAEEGSAVEMSPVKTPIEDTKKIGESLSLPRQTTPPPKGKAGSSSVRNSLHRDDEEEKEWAEGMLLANDPKIHNADVRETKFKSRLSQFVALTKKVIEDNKEKRAIKRKLSFKDKINFVLGRSSYSPETDGVSLIRIVDTDVYIEKMKALRAHCASINKVPLYHYTMPTIVPSILRGGLRMSTQGQGDGGVYFSTLGPCSYGMGNQFHMENNSLDRYEDALIKDCFGVERLNEYKNSGKLEALLVYAIPLGCLQPAPGGRDNALVVSKTTFQDLSLPDHDGNFFLDPSNIIGAFHISPFVPPKCSENTVENAETEHINDIKVQLAVRKAKKVLDTNVDESTKASFSVIGGRAGPESMEIIQARTKRSSMTKPQSTKNVLQPDGDDKASTSKPSSSSLLKAAMQAKKGVASKSKKDNIGSV